MRAQIGKPIGDIHPEDVKPITFLYAYPRGVGSLSGIQCLPLTQASFEVAAPTGQVLDLSPLRGHPNLRSLNLSGNEVADLAPLAQVEDLETLTLERMVRSVSVAPLAKLPHLWALHLDSDVVNGLASLAELASLRSLDLNGCVLDDPGALARLTQVTRLGLSQVSSDLTAVKDLVQLRSLALEANGLVDLSLLGGLERLRTLDLVDNGIADISPLAGMKELATLYLNGNRVADLAPLTGLRDLSWLELGDNHVSTLSAIANNPGVGANDLVMAYDNPLDCAAEAANIATLTERGASVLSDCPERP